MLLCVYETSWKDETMTKTAKLRMEKRNREGDRKRQRLNKNKNKKREHTIKFVHLIPSVYVLSLVPISFRMCVNFVRIANETQAHHLFFAILLFSLIISVIQYLYGNDKFYAAIKWSEAKIVSAFMPKPQANVDQNVCRFNLIIAIIKFYENSCILICDADGHKIIHILHPKPFPFDCDCIGILCKILLLLLHFRFFFLNGCQWFDAFFFFFFSLFFVQLSGFIPLWCIAFFLCSYLFIFVAFDTSYIPKHTYIYIYSHSL